MHQEELRDKLLSDLSELNLPIDEVEISLRPYSKTYYGRYFPVYNDKETKPIIYIYPYETPEGDFMSYDTILKTAIHELCHHIQYTNGSFVRVRGVMHNPQFWKLHNFYIERAMRYELLGGESLEISN